MQDEQDPGRCRYEASGCWSKRDDEAAGRQVLAEVKKNPDGQPSSKRHREVAVRSASSCIGSEAARPGS